MFFVVPTCPELYRERNLDGRANRFEDLANRRQVAQQPRSAIALDHLLRRTAQVEINQVEAEILDHPRRVRHYSRIAAKKLGRDGMLVLVEVQVALGFLVFCPKNSVRRSELGHNQPASAQVANEAPKHGISNTRHRSQNGRGSNLNAADLYPVRYRNTGRDDDARAEIHRILPVLAHLAILPPSPSYAAVSQFASHNLMDETPRTSSAEPPTLDTAKWIGLLLAAVILGEGIWGLIVSLTNNLILPLLARTMGADAQSPLYLGKGDFNAPALFMSVLELCFAGIVAVILNSWVRRRSKPIRGRVVRSIPIPTDPTITIPSIPAVVPVQAAASAPAPEPAPAAAAATATSSGQFWAPPEPDSQPKAAAPPAPPAPAKAPAKPAKPKPPKEVYYNIVGEPINPTEDD